METHNYVLTVRIPLPDNPDDMSARLVAKGMLRTMGLTGLSDATISGLSNTEAVKLQEIFTDKPPRKIEI
jgi:hypothetical protein